MKEQELIQFVNSSPKQSKQVFEGLTKQFQLDLVARARTNMAGRNSNTMTDADLAIAFGDITKPHDVSVARRCVGDGAMILGAALVPLGGIHWAISVLGILMCAIGMFVREYRHW